MGYFFIGLIAIVIFYILFNKKNLKATNPIAKSIETQGRHPENMEVPNPATANPKDVIFFITNWSAEVVKQVYGQLLDRGIIIPEELAILYRRKIKGEDLFRHELYWNTSIENYQEEKENLKQFSNTYIFEIKGLQIESYVERLDGCIIYDKIKLVKDPNNKYDADAIKVIASGGIIGHVPRDETTEIHEIMKIEHKVFIKEIIDSPGYLFASAIIHYN